MNSTSYIAAPAEPPVLAALLASPCSRSRSQDLVTANTSAWTRR